MKRTYTMTLSILAVALIVFLLPQSRVQGGHVSDIPEEQVGLPTADLDSDQDDPQTTIGTEDELTHPAALGLPGFTLRYTGTLGKATQAYLEDTTHLNFPYGVGTDGSQVWIADAYGSRALKYAQDGAFVQQIGQAGFPSGIEGTDLEWIAEVAVDALGQIWLVDRGANHVSYFDALGNLLGDLGQPWISGVGNDLFSGPEGIAFDSAGNIYISDSSNHRIQVFTAAGIYLNTIGVTNVPGSGNLYLNYPRHIAMDQDDQLYVADGNNHRVQIFDVSQPLTITRVASLGVSGVPGSENNRLNNPAGVAVDASRIYVADQGNSRVQIFDRQTRGYLETLAAPGSGEDQFLSPTDVAVDSAGNLFVVDHEQARVQQYDSSLQFVRSYGVTGVPYLTDTAHYNRPAGLVLTADGGMLLAESYGQRLLKFDASGVFAWQVGEAGVWGEDAAHFNRPADVASGPDGSIYVADRNNHRVQIFTAAGDYADTLGGTPGTGEAQFLYPRGLAVDSAGRLYVADTGNHRVQIYDSSLNYLGSLGQTGVPGTGDDQLNEPFDVSVDQAGKIYVADHSNHRLQVYDDTWNLLFTIGVSGLAGQDFAHLDDPTAVEVDGDGRIYVADNWGGRIQVFDAQGAYLTTLGNSWGSRTGDLRQVQGLALKNDGSLLIADTLNHRLQHFMPGMPGWQQSNLNGFGDPLSWWVAALTEFNGSLYAGVHHSSGSGAQLWKAGAGQDWSPVMTDGFGELLNAGISSLTQFKGWLYAGTENVSGTQVYRSEDGLIWEGVVTDGFGSQQSNLSTTAMGVFDGQLYAAAGNWLDLAPIGAQLWRSEDGSTWTDVALQGFGNANNTTILALEAIGGYFYAGTRNEITGGELWRSASGDPDSWSQVNLDGFGEAANTAVVTLVEYNGWVYAGTRNWSSGAQLWRSADGLSWTKVVGLGFGDGDASGWVDSLTVYNHCLVAVLRNYNDGAKVFTSHDGYTWRQVNPDGWGDNNNPHTGSGDGAAAIFNGRLFIGTGNVASGGEIWNVWGFSTFLPAVRK